MKRRVAACQILSFPDQDNTPKIIEWIEKAAKEKVHAVCFPESSLTGYEKRDDFLHDMPPEGMKKKEQKIIRAARKHKVAVIVGSAYWEGDKVMNCALVIDQDGTVRGRYNKTHLASNWDSPGNELPIYRVAGTKSCFIICHDGRYPELVRLPAIRGAEICWWPTNGSGLTYEYKFEMSRALPIARACENDIFMVYCNSPADPHDVLGKHQSIGRSMIVDPEGCVIAEANHFDERLLIADIDTAQARRRWPLRAVNDDSILRDWMRRGAEFINDRS